MEYVLTVKDYILQRRDFVSLDQEIVFGYHYAEKFPTLLAARIGANKAARALGVPVTIFWDYGGKDELSCTTTWPKA
jgi:hypothetical protein